MRWTYEAFFGPNPAPAYPALQGQASARLRDAPRYAISLQVNLPPIFLPWVDPTSLKRTAGLNFDLATKENLGRFEAASQKIFAERDLLLRTFMREWRLPTESEDRRFRSLEAEHELVVAQFERTLSIQQ